MDILVTSRYQNYHYFFQLFTILFKL